MDPKIRDLWFGIGAIIVIAGLLLWFFLAKSHPRLPSSIPTASSTAISSPSKNVPDTRAPAASVTEHGQYYDIDLKYPSATPLLNTAGALADTQAVNIMQVFSQNTADGFKENSNLTQLTPEDIHMQGLDQGRKYSLSDTYKYYSSPTTISYLFTLDEDTLGAHPNSFFRTFMFDAKTGTSLALPDMFTSPKYLNTLSTLSRQMLAAQEGPNASTQMINDGTTPDEDNFQNFVLDGSDLVLFFPPYQVGPYALGPQTVRIPLRQLKDLLKPQYQ